MSLILEALRKSEAQRRRGQAPQLDVELPPLPTTGPRRGMPGWLLPVVVLLVVLLALAAWLWPRTQAEPQDTAQATEGTQVTAPPAPDAAMAELPPLVAPEPQASSESSTSVPPPEPVTPAPVVQAPPVAAGTPPAPPVATAPPPTPIEDTPAPATAGTTPTPRGGVLGMADLDPAARRALPPLHLSMHMWNDDPARRFVILDGRRLGENDRIGELLVHRIERDGVVMDWNGQLLRLPMR